MFLLLFHLLSNALKFGARATSRVQPLGGVVAVVSQRIRAGSASSATWGARSVTSARGEARTGHGQLVTVSVVHSIAPSS